MKTCLITGGAGFIGCEVTKIIENAFDNIIIVDCLHPQIHASQKIPPRLSSKANLIIADVTDPVAWDEVLSKWKPDLVLHLAAETGTGQSLTESSRHTQVNVVGTSQMLDAMVRQNAFPRKIVLASSRAIYGEGKWINSEGVAYYPGQRSNEQLANGEWNFYGSKFLPMNSTDNIPMPTSIYGVTKLAQEQIISCWCKSFDVNYSILRLQNVYGPGQSLINSYTGIVSLFVRLAKEKQIIPLYEDGMMLRDFVFITDVARAISEVLVNDTTNGKILDIGSGYGATIKEIAHLIAERYGAPRPEVCGKYRNGDVRHAQADISYTLDNMDWKPVVSLDEGMNLLCNWIDEELGR
ncbi:NAD-dependent epimerase/dehydratase family protein [Paenibacillus sp. 3LSP]|uniref:NAD-dependent epimerase/dehydratase family protein n=1 Tax=Paenibacillus sp. 3LSP TaxID=2800795 RepID=UPI0028FD992F|nr:NAD-dependent epimerase/dehydratase family protein [Paenibacillus sp. 3LSP]MDU0332794.1 NAD-dependent epimerase/dehydratase family protein [Paenibacillus sp. 3LSP]